jgi:hypothetical protein
MAEYARQVYWNLVPLSVLPMRILKIAGLVLVALVACAAMAYAWFLHSFRLDFGPSFSQDMEAFGIAMKGSLGEVLFTYKGQHLQMVEVSPGGNFEDLLKASKNASEGADNANVAPLMEQYRKDPERFKRYASLLDTALNAMAVGDAILAMTSSAKIPGTSDEIPALRGDESSDSWGHHFCLLQAKQRVAVVSAGPEASGNPVCEELGSIERKFFLPTARCTSGLPEKWSSLSIVSLPKRLLSRFFPTSLRKKPPSPAKLPNFLSLNCASIGLKRCRPD